MYQESERNIREKERNLLPLTLLYSFSSKYPFPSFRSLSPPCTFCHPLTLFFSSRYPSPFSRSLLFPHPFLLFPILLTLSYSTLSPTLALTLPSSSHSLLLSLSFLNVSTYSHIRIHDIKRPM